MAGPLFSSPELRALVTLESALRVCPETQALYRAAEAGALAASGIAGFISVTERFQASLVRRALAARGLGIDLSHPAAFSPVPSEVMLDVLHNEEDWGEARGALPRAVAEGLGLLRRAGWEDAALAPLQLSVRANRYRECPLRTGSPAPDAALGTFVARGGADGDSGDGGAPPTLHGALRRASRENTRAGAPPRPVLCLGVSYS
jgi:hypothetical protein